MMSSISLFYSEEVDTQWGYVFCTKCLGNGMAQPGLRQPTSSALVNHMSVPRRGC